MTNIYKHTYTISVTITYFHIVILNAYHPIVFLNVKLIHRGKYCG